ARKPESDRIVDRRGSLNHQQEQNARRHSAGASMRTPTARDGRASFTVAIYKLGLRRSEISLSSFSASAANCVISAETALATPAAASSTRPGRPLLSWCSSYKGLP